MALDWVETALELKQKGVSWTRLPQELSYLYPHMSFTFDMVRNRLRRTKEYKKGKVTYVDKKSCDNQDVQSLIDQLINIQHSLLDVRLKQTEATLTIEDNKPIGIAKWGDWHMGGIGTDHHRLFRDADTIAQADGLYVFGMGDYGERFTGSIKGTPHEQILNPDNQQKLVLYIMEKVRDKMLALVGGCHEFFVYKESNTDLTAECAKVADAVDLWHGGDVYLNFGLEQYHYRVRHRFIGESEINPTNAHRRMMEEKGPCDVQTLAHRHFGDLHCPPKMGRQVVWMRSGTYKYLDEHGQRIAGWQGMYAVPITVIYPDQHKIVPFLDFEAGLEHLAFLRSNLQQV